LGGGEHDAKESISTDKTKKGTAWGRKGLFKKEGRDFYISTGEKKMIRNRRDGRKKEKGFKYSVGLGKKRRKKKGGSLSR